MSCLLNNFNKSRSDKLSMDFNLDVPLFVEFSNFKEGSLVSKVVVKCHKNSVFFRFSEETKMVAEFLMKNFFGSKVDVNYSQRVAKVPIKSKEEYFVLRKLLAKKVKFSDFLHVRFTYNEEELIRLYANTKNKKKSFLLWDKECDVEYSYYAELNSSYGDGFELIRQRYLELIKMYHPDRVYGKDEETIKRYTEKFIKVHNAFEQLRKTYQKVAS
jgi:molecular chaperone DnaJ